MTPVKFVVRRIKVTGRGEVKFEVDFGGNRRMSSLGLEIEGSRRV